VIAGGALKVDHDKVEAIMKWKMPTNFSNSRMFIGRTQYLRKIIVSFSPIATPLHAITTSGKSF